MEDRRRALVWDADRRAAVSAERAGLRTAPCSGLCPPARAAGVSDCCSQPAACGEAGKRHCKGDAENDGRQVPPRIHWHGRSVSVTTCLSLCSTSSTIKTASQLCSASVDAVPRPAIDLLAGCTPSSRAGGTGATRGRPASHLVSWAHLPRSTHKADPGEERATGNRRSPGERRVCLQMKGFCFFVRDF